jgi:hypothetical protein
MPGCPPSRCRTCPITLVYRHASLRPGRLRRGLVASEHLCQVPSAFPGGDPRRSESPEPVTDPNLIGPLSAVKESADNKCVLNKPSPLGDEPSGEPSRIPQSRHRLIHATTQRMTRRMTLRMRTGVVKRRRSCRPTPNHPLRTRRQFHCPCTRCAVPRRDCEGAGRSTATGIRAERPDEPTRTTATRTVATE